MEARHSVNPSTKPTSQIPIQGKPPGGVFTAEHDMITQAVAFCSLRSCLPIISREPSKQDFK